MGIRFERDSRKATNGPLIFFSMVKDEAFEEEIRSAFHSGLSFYAYRYPHDHMMTFGSSEGYIEGLGEPGFVIGLFSPQLPIITIPYKGIKQSGENLSLYNMPSKSTDYNTEYKVEVEEIIKSIKEGKVEKVVAARVIVKDTEIDLANYFYDLCRKFPDAYVFCFSTPVTGCWIGASPELLLEGKEKIIRSMALAGTRLMGSLENWDEKNIEEQNIVTDYISGIFRKNNIEPIIDETYTKGAGNIEHICTPVMAKIEERYDIHTLKNLITDLSPTPALCGYPKNIAIDLIRKYEDFDRGCYGGFCGPFHCANDFTLNVVLRCLSVSEKRFCAYCGGGITAKSDVKKEWEETELKFQNIISESTF